jgi:hypothetical protein
MRSTPNISRFTRHIALYLNRTVSAAVSLICGQNTRLTNVLVETKKNFDYYLDVMASYQPQFIFNAKFG